jgi:Fe-S cluster assembly scaffold protein SufB
MSMNIDIYETVYKLEVETSISDNINFLEIETSTKDFVEISSDYFGSVVFASDIVGLDDYLANYLDDYEIDCGSP